MSPDAPRDSDGLSDRPLLPPGHGQIWSDEGKLATWLEVELAAIDAWAELASSRADAARALREHASAPTPERVAEIEATHHDTAAFVDAVAEGLGEEGRWFHYGLTSSDVVDTALALQIREAGRADPRGDRPRLRRRRRARRGAPHDAASAARTGSTPSRRRSG